MSRMHELISTALIDDVDRINAYALIVSAFGQLTAITHPESGVCCIKKDKHGAPLCCYTLTNGECQLTFTDQELYMLASELNPKVNGIAFFKDGDIWRAECRDKKRMRESLHTGMLAKTLECASHPTRPVINDGHVTGVVVVKDCMAEYAFATLKENASDFLWLWKEAVRMWGVKPYYITHGFDNPDQFEWLIDELTA
jgi:hypothetical protein